MTRNPDLPSRFASGSEAREARAIPRKARKMYEAIYSETERAQYEKAYQHPCGCTCGCDILAHEGEDICTLCFLGSHMQLGSDNTLAGQLNEAGYGSGGMF